MLRSRLPVFFVACALAFAGVVGLMSTGSPTPGVSLSATHDAATPTTSERPDVAVAVTEATTSTIAVPEVTTTAPAITTTTAHEHKNDTVVSAPTTTAAPPAPPTTVFRVTPTTAPRGLDPGDGAAELTGVNNYPGEIQLQMADLTEVGVTMPPGSSFGQIFMPTSGEHGDSVSFTRTDMPCGYGDGEDYFKAGHRYHLELKAGAAGACGPGIAGVVLVIHDLTTGTSRQL